MRDQIGNAFINGIYNFPNFGVLYVHFPKIFASGSKKGRKVTKLQNKEHAEITVMQTHPISLERKLS